MPDISLTIYANYSDRQGLPLFSELPTTQKTYTIDDHTITVTRRLAENAELLIQQLPKRGLMVGELLFYSKDPTVVCFRDPNGEFIQRHLTETGIDFKTQSRFAIETPEHVLWCYEERTYSVKLAPLAGQ